MTSTVPPGPAVSVLVVDDSPDARTAMRHVLVPMGYRVVEAGSGEEALRHLLREDFAVVLLDVRMPGLDGFEVAALIRRRERTRAVPIIFVSGEAVDAQHVSLAYSMGAVDYLLKPVTPEAVRAKVAVFAEQHRHSEQIRRQAELLREVERSEQERKLAELRLSSERRFRAVTDAMPQIVWTARPDGGADYFNRRWFEYTGLGFTGDGPCFTAAMHPEEQEPCAEAWRVAVASGTPFQAECRLRRGDGALRWHLARAVPEYDQTGAIVAWLGTLTDIDDQKLAAAEAREAVRIRDEFLSVASHELRTPLTALALQVQSLVRALRSLPSVLPERAFERLRVMERQVTRMARLVDELLDVSRLSAGQIRLSIEELDLPALVREVVEQISDRDARDRCPIEVHADGPVVGVWDRMRVEQVVTNLLTNALKFCDNKPIEVAVDQTDGAARLVVRDHGIGIKPEDRERIFGRFERAVSAREYGGLGLGLYITREIVKTHGGTITVESQPGDGARFVVELPLKPRETM